jgi:hypothetical protein
MGRRAGRRVRHGCATELTLSISQGAVYVAPDGNDTTNDGLSMGAPLKTITAALNKLASVGGGEIRCAPGVHNYGATDGTGGGSTVRLYSNIHLRGTTSGSPAGGTVITRTVDDGNPMFDSDPAQPLGACVIEDLQIFTNLTPIPTASSHGARVQAVLPHQQLGDPPRRRAAAPRRRRQPRPQRDHRRHGARHVQRRAHPGVRGVLRRLRGERDRQPGRHCQHARRHQHARRSAARRQRPQQPGRARRAAAHVGGRRPHRCVHAAGAAGQLRRADRGHPRRHFRRRRLLHRGRAHLRRLGGGRAAGRLLRLQLHQLAERHPRRLHAGHVAQGLVLLRQRAHVADPHRVGARARSRSCTTRRGRRTGAATGGRCLVARSC